MQIRVIDPGIFVPQTKRDVALTTLLFVSGAYVAQKVVSSYIWRRRYDALRASKQRQTAQKKRALDEALRLCESSDDSADNNHRQICHLGFRELQASLATGDLQPIDVLRAYQRKALQADSRFNCITEPIEDAADTALALADGGAEARTGKPRLFGIPVSVKDHITVRGHQPSTGLVRYNSAQVTGADSSLVAVLRSQGAVPFAITNVPQACASLDCGNPVFGETRNPRDPDRTPGGSSGGEAALIAAGGSVLGWGSDQAGSVRMPAAMCGICAFKPTTGRLCYRGVSAPFHLNPTVGVTCGPMARDVYTLCEAMRAVLCAPEMLTADRLVPPVGFDEARFRSTGPLRIGYYTTLPDTVIRAVPTVQRAVREAKAAMESRGHHMVEWRFPEVDKAVHLLTLSLFGDGGSGILRALEHERIDPVIGMLHFVLRLPSWTRRLLAWLLRPISPSKSAHLSAIDGLTSVTALYAHVAEVNAQVEEVDAAWAAARLDALICPVLPFPAMPFGGSGDVMTGVNYAGVYNLVNYAAGVLPWTKVTEADQTALDGPDADCYPTSGDHASVRAHQRGATGLPIGVQVVSMRWHDEVCLRLMTELEEAAASEQSISLSNTHEN